jgi:hypothetical protein
MSDFDMVVNTEPMADSIESVTTHVDAATVAVVGMQAAVIQAEKEAADAICDNVNRGFHSLILSQISQKKIKAQIQAETLLVSLRQSAQALLRIRNQFTRDFERISSRYARLFKILDDALRSRIFELDKSAVLPSGAGFKSIEKGSLGSGAATLVIHKETLEAGSRLQAGQIKTHCKNIMSDMRTVISRNMALKKNTSNVLLPRSVQKRTYVYLPVIVMEADDLFLPACTLSTYAVGGAQDIASLQKQADLITRKILESRDAFSWSPVPDERRMSIASSCAEAYISGQTGKREAAVMMDLLKGLTWLELGKGTP